MQNWTSSTVHYFKRIPLRYVFAEPFEAQLKQSMSEVKVQVLSYFHSVDNKAQLASYLQKSTFDDSITGDTVHPLISKYLSSDDKYEFPRIKLMPFVGSKESDTAGNCKHRM